MDARLVLFVAFALPLVAPRPSAAADEPLLTEEQLSRYRPVRAACIEATPDARERLLKEAGLSRATADLVEEIIAELQGQVAAEPQAGNVVTIELPEFTEFLHMTYGMWLSTGLQFLSEGPERDACVRAQKELDACRERKDARGMHRRMLEWQVAMAGEDDDVSDAKRELRMMEEGKTPPKLQEMIDEWEKSRAKLRGEERPKPESGGKKGRGLLASPARAKNRALVRKWLDPLGVERPRRAVDQGSIADLRRDLKGSPEARGKALEKLADHPEAAKALPEILVAFDEAAAAGDPHSHLGLAAEALGDIGAPAVEPLVDRLGGSPAAAFHAADALGRMGPAAKTAAPALVKRMEGAEPMYRPHFAGALSKIGVHDEATFLALQKAALSEDPGLSAAGASALGSAPSFAERAVPTLRVLLQRKGFPTRVAAVSALAALGDPGLRALHEDYGKIEASEKQMLLLGLSTREEEDAEKPARRSPLLVDFVRRCSRDDDLQVATAANHLLAAWGESNDAEIERLVAALDSEDAMARMTALSALGDLGPRAAPAVPKLRALLADESLAMLVVPLLGQIGPAAAEALPELRALRSKPFFAMFVEDAIARIEGRTPPGEEDEDEDE